MESWGIILFLPLMLWAQPEFFGYFESEADLMQLGTVNYNFGYNKFRLDVEARPNDNVLIGANVNIQKYWGKTSWNIYDFLPGYANSGLVQNIELQDTIMVDNVYMRLTFPWLDMTLGRQQISPGVGYAWNPTDIFNSRSLLDPSYEQTGIAAIRSVVPLGNRSSFEMVMIPADNFENATKQFWLNGGFGRFDFSLTTAQQQWQSLHAFTYGYGEEDERWLHGGSLVGEILGWGVWTEFGVNNIVYSSFYELYSSSSIIAYEPPIDSFNEYVFGLDHTFDNSVYVLGEYLHNEYGKAKADELIIYDYLYSLSGKSHSLMQDYGFLYLMHPTFDLVSLSALAIANFNDNSGTFAPQLDWNIFDDTNISLQGSLFWGEEDTEFGLQDWGLRLRLRSDF